MAIKKRTDQLPAILSGDVDNNDLMYLVHENAQAETGYDSKKILVSDVGRKLNNGVEYVSELSSFPSGHQNPLDALELLKQEILDLYPVNSASGSIANFTTSLALPLVALKAYIVAQGGGGTPSAPVAITGFDSIKIGQTSGQSDWSECFRGLFKGTHSFVDLGSLSWTYQSATQRFISSKSDQASYNVGDMPSYATPPYTTIAVMNSTQWNNYTGDKAITFISTNYIAIRDKYYTDALDLKEALDGVYLIYKLATPTTPTITLSIPEFGSKNI